MYDLASLSWRPFSDCADENNYMMLYIFETLTVISTIMNILTFLKITFIMVP